MARKYERTPEDIAYLEDLLKKLGQDEKRINWLEKQAGHIFDTSSGGGFRFCWRQGDKKTVRNVLDEGMAQDAEFNSVNDQRVAPATEADARNQKKL